MRIRKRSGPLGLPSSSISTTTILSSDPPLTSTRKHEEEEEEEEKKRLYPDFGDEHQPSDQVHQTTSKMSSSDLELTFIRGKNGWVCCSDDGDNRGGLVVEEKDVCMMNTNPTQKMVLKGPEEDQMMIRSSTATTKNNRRGNSLSGEEEEVINFGSGVPPCSSNISSHDDPHQVVLLHEMWCERSIKGFPMKKRRGSNWERKVLGDEEDITRTTEIMNKQKKIMKTATNPNEKWVLHEKDSQELTTDGTSSAKKNEGSRCSRINGRGWRCYQLALVGYSLCEHHSWKGRLWRSMNTSTVRNGSGTTTADVAKPIKNLETRPVSLEKCHEGDEEKTSSTSMIRVENKKRKKTGGMVKARSISSLLGQTQVHDDHHYVSV